MIAYIDRTGADTRQYHAAIMAAIANDGKFPEEFADIFALTRTPTGSKAEWFLDFV
jgi:hypothetical protein